MVDNKKHYKFDLGFKELNIKEKIFVTEERCRHIS